MTLLKSSSSTKGFQSLACKEYQSTSRVKTFFTLPCVPVIIGYFVFSSISITDKLTVCEKGDSSCKILLKINLQLFA